MSGPHEWDLNRIGACVETDIVKADRRFRDLAFLLYAVIVLAGVAFFRFGLPGIRAYFYTLGVMDALVVMRRIFILLLLSFTPAAVYLIGVGRATIRHGCFPYPGRKVMFDTRVKRGVAARKIGKAFITLGVVFLVLMVLSVVHTYFRMGGWINNELFQKFYGRPTMGTHVISSVPRDCNS